MVRRAEQKGMVVNASKTALMCVSDASSYAADTYIEDRDGNRVETVDKMKILGFTLSNRPGMHLHVETIKKRMRERYWVLRHLRRLGFSQSELVRVYTTVIRPVAEYCAVVYHSSLTDEQDEALDRLQNHALKCIYGTKMKAAEMRGLAGLETLRKRREDLSDSFFKKCLKSDRFADWLPKKPPTRTRAGQGEVFVEEKARCDRLFNSPVFYARRRLNGKIGKKYGLRNAEYRN